MRRREVIVHQPTGAMTGQVIASLRKAQYADCTASVSLSPLTAERYAA